jgi:prepilin-type N-terminal cleavage/methylation domain-containing protein
VRTLHAHIRPEKGFSLIELLIVILILGILATIALPAFLGEQEKGLDADAKANTRNVVASVESCYTETKSYETCDTLPELEAVDTKPGVELTDTVTKKKGAVAVSATDETYTVTAYSKSSNTFVVAKDADGTSTRSW